MYIDDLDIFPQPAKESRVSNVALAMIRQNAISRDG
jgi:hypothetical protein